MRKRSVLTRAWIAGLLLALLVGIGPILSRAAGPGTRAGDAVSEQLVAAQRKPSTGTANASLTADWWSTVQRNIRKAEYHVTRQEQTYLPDVPAAFQAPNRAHNLRTYFASQGPIVIPRVWPEGADAAPWRWGASLAAWGRGETLTPASAAVLHAEENRIEYRRDEIVEWYRNDGQGLEQGFLLPAAPGGDPAPAQREQPGRLELRLGGDLSARLNEEQLEVEFRTGDGETMLHCGPLRVADADGRPLPTWLSLQGQTLAILFDDTSAAYPIEVAWTVTGLPPDDDWRRWGDVPTSQFGFSVATAGDVNGDGYSDVIVGAPGQASNGYAFAYYGSASSLAEAAGWTKASDRENALFGFSVGIAGDVNGDGYADVIVGAPNYNRVLTDEGQAFVYFGNGGPGLRLALKQRAHDGSLLAPLGHSDTNRFLVELYYSNPFGRGLEAFEMEVKPLGQGFDGTDTYKPFSTVWVNLGLGSVTWPSTDDLRPDTPYHWRIRTLYHPATTPWMPASRWVTIPWNGWNEQDLRTGGGLVFLPVVMKSYEDE